MATPRSCSFKRIRRAGVARWAYLMKGSLSAVPMLVLSLCGWDASVLAPQCLAADPSDDQSKHASFGKPRLRTQISPPNGRHFGDRAALVLRNRPIR